MAEEVNEERPEKEASGALGKIILILGVVLVAAIGGLTTYLFVLKPMLEEAAEVAESEQASNEDPIPLFPVEIEFPQTPVNVIREGQAPAAMLLFGVTLECENQETANLVTQHQARFRDMINKRHDSRTRNELDDVLLIKESIQRQILQKANDMLKRLQEKPADNIRITSVFHHTFVVNDPL